MSVKYNAAEHLNEEHIVLYYDCDEDFLKARYFDSTKIIQYTEIIAVNGIVPNYLSNLKIIDLNTALTYESVLFVLATKDTKKLENVVAKIGEKKSFDHITHFGKFINVQTLKILGYDDYYDFCNNHIVFDKCFTGSCTVSRFNNIDVKNNTIKIGRIYVTDSLDVALFGNNGCVTIGNDNTFIETKIEITTNGNVTIGDDCMFSLQIRLQQPDQHMIFDAATRKRINKDKNISIGNHVWMGLGAVLLGGANIPDNCVIGRGSVTSKKFNETSCILAGVPAKIVRRNVLWSRDNQRLDYQVFSQCKDQTALKYMTTERNP